MFNHNAWWATQSSGAPPSPIVPDQLTESGLLHSDPISAMRPAVYPPVTLEGRLSANDNSSFQFDQELGESAGLYKPAVPDPQHHTWAYTSAATSAKPGPPSPTRNLAATSAGIRNGTGIIYPLQPRSRRPDICIDVEATLPEPAALLCPDLQQQPRVKLPQASHAPPDDTVVKGVEIAPQQSTAPPNAHLHGGTGVIYKHLNWLTGINKICLWLV